MATVNKPLLSLKPLSSLCKRSISTIIKPRPNENSIKSPIKINPERKFLPTTIIRNASSYKGAILLKIGEPLIINNFKPKEKLKDDEVRIKVDNCAVNVSDYFMCQGLYEAYPPQPFIPGFEVCGHVIEKGSKTDDLKDGDKVIGLAKETFGCFAEQCVLNIKDVWRVPNSMKSDKAAALVDSYATVLLGIRRANLEPKDPVLVTAASGGLGLAAVDIAANLYKAKVLGACGTEDKASIVREKGAFSAVNYNKKEIIEAAMSFTDKKGVKVIFDAVGGDVTNDSLQCIAHEGSIIIAGFASRKIPHIPTNLLLPKSCALIGVSLTQYRLNAYKIYRDVIKEVIEMYEDDFLDPHISATYKLEEVNEAFKFIEEGSSTGKVILSMN